MKLKSDKVLKPIDTKKLNFNSIKYDEYFDSQDSKFPRSNTRYYTVDEKGLKGNNNRITQLSGGNIFNQGNVNQQSFKPEMSLSPIKSAKKQFEFQVDPHAKVANYTHNHYFNNQSVKDKRIEEEENKLSFTSSSSSFIRKQKLKLNNPKIMKKSSKYFFKYKKDSVLNPVSQQVLPALSTQQSAYPSKSNFAKEVKVVINSDPVFLAEDCAKEINFSHDKKIFIQSQDSNEKISGGSISKLQEMDLNQKFSEKNIQMSRYSSPSSRRSITTSKRKNKKKIKYLNSLQILRSLNNIKDAEVIIESNNSFIKQNKQSNIYRPKNINSKPLDLTNKQDNLLKVAALYKSMKNFPGEINYYKKLLNSLIYLEQNKHRIGNLKKFIDAKINSKKLRTNNKSTISIIDLRSIDNSMISNVSKAVQISGQEDTELPDLNELNNPQELQKPKGNIKYQLLKEHKRMMTEQSEIQIQEIKQIKKAINKGTSLFDLLEPKVQSSKVKNTAKIAQTFKDVISKKKEIVKLPSCLSKVMSETEYKNNFKEILNFEKKNIKYEAYYQSLATPKSCEIQKLRKSKHKASVSVLASKSILSQNANLKTKSDDKSARECITSTSKSNIQSHSKGGLSLKIALAGDESIKKFDYMEMIQKCTKLEKMNYYVRNHMFDTLSTYNRKDADN